VILLIILFTTSFTKSAIRRYNFPPLVAGHRVWATKITRTINTETNNNNISITNDGHNIRVYYINILSNIKYVHNNIV